MAIIKPVQGYAPMQRQRKDFFPFVNGMRSQIFKGVGANRAAGVWFKDGKLKKMLGTESFKNLADATSIVYMGEYQKSDGTYQMLVAYAVSTYYVLRAIEEDGTIVTPTGGAGDVHFTSSLFSSVQLFALTFVGNNSSTTPFHSWNGTLLTAVTDSSLTLIKGVARDGKRIAVISDNSVNFSSDGLTTTWTNTGVNANGKYSTSLRNPKALISGGMGIIVIGDTGSEAHKVVPNAASDEVSADTKIDGYNDNAIGTDMQQKACMGKTMTWRVTEGGIIATNPFNGESTNVTEMGRINEYWDTWDTTTASIAYDELNEQIVCSVKEGAQNDILVCIDVTKEELPISIKTSQYYRYLTSIDNQLYGGGSRNGDTDKLFSSLTTVTHTNTTFRYISEWDELSNQLYWKLFKRLYVAANLSPDSSMTVKIYFDGEVIPKLTKTFTSEDMTTSASGMPLYDAPYGMYIFGGGAADMEAQNTDILGENKVTKRFSTVCVEVTESSGEPFELYDMILEYKTKNKFYHSLSRKSALFQ